jgi:hypothetical protein
MPNYDILHINFKNFIKDFLNLKEIYELDFPYWPGLIIVFFICSTLSDRFISENRTNSNQQQLTFDKIIIQKENQNITKE